MKTYHLHITGQVQGVGFRPFVYQTALVMGLKGWVNNGLDGVHVEFEAEEEIADHFVDRILSGPPARAKIATYDLQEVESRNYHAFDIVESENSGTANLLLSPDFALCDACREELHDEENRRYQYPFITCTQCGPRYSIISGLPYDRERTSMAEFGMCETCEAEYHDPLNKRHFSQTNSCPDCAIQLEGFHQGKTVSFSSPTAAIHQMASALLAGEIIAIKGIGGFLLMCDAGNEASIQQLRVRKHRPAKPFALMYPDLETIRLDVQLDPSSADVLQGPISPIVLLPMKEKIGSGICVEQVAPGLQEIGVMLPYAPLLELVASAFGRPLVATSGNLSGKPIAFTNEEGRALHPVADWVLLHNRDIQLPQDDSVYRALPHPQPPILLRRSRGLAPSLRLPGWSAPDEPILAMGAHMKSTFALNHGDHTYLSQYLGVLDNFDTQLHYEHSLRYWLDLLELKPTRVLVDLHPQYASSQLGQAVADQLGVQIRTIQHHEAHAAAILAEHTKWQTDERILCLIWDGTGLGWDGHIWGGESFLFEEGEMERVAHLPYFPTLAGDKMAKEPRLSALSIAKDLPKVSAQLEGQFSQTEWQVFQSLLGRVGMQSSSMGRLFDAVAAGLGLSGIQSYEGEAALRLESQAWQYVRRHAWPKVPASLEPSSEFPLQQMMLWLSESQRAGKSVPELAAAFHVLLGKYAAAQAEFFQVKTMAFSGGCFQNALLTTWLRQHLSSSYQLLFHTQLPANDEHVAFGQMVRWRMEEATFTSQSPKYVSCNPR